MLAETRTVPRAATALPIALTLGTLLPAQGSVAETRAPSRPVAGVWPHLAMFNEQNECGTGALVPWQGDLYAITYAPHRPNGSDDRLYRVTSDLEQIPFAGSVGGTPANRMVHAETDQLLIGPYLIARDGDVRVIPPDAMRGRLTGVARHLTDPARKVYYATMEEGVYEVDVASLDVTELFADHQGQISGRGKARTEPSRLMAMPGYHGKGLYSGQGRLIYANNGEPGRAAQQRPDVPSGVLAEWTGGEAPWRVVRRAQFTDISGPGGLRGNAEPARDPIWAIGFDHRSLLLMLLDAGEWSTFRLPKASHCYDGAHGWNTEWPRFRDLGAPDSVLLNMHGMFWSFPKGFRAGRTAGIAPRSTYLKVIGDTARFGEHIVFGCDDTARNEFLNRRKAKGGLRGPGTSHSNLWFVKRDRLDQLGPPLGHGAVWLNDDVEAGRSSDPYLCSTAGGPRRFAHRTLILAHAADSARRFFLEFDIDGSGEWVRQADLNVPAKSGLFVNLPTTTRAQWVRLVTAAPTPGATAIFHDRAADSRQVPERSAASLEPRFAPLLAAAETDSSARIHSSGLLWMRPGARRSLSFVLDAPAGDSSAAAEQPTHYELLLPSGERTLQLVPAPDQAAAESIRAAVALPSGVLEHDAASVSYVDDAGTRWRLPRWRADFGAASPFGGERIDREVVTERDLFNAGGLFYELPAQNAGGFAKIRPIASHGLRIRDYASYRGLLILSGIAEEAPEDHPRVIRSADGRAALWLGVVDDLWSAGKPSGVGGPWLDSAVSARSPSDPYLLNGFDRVTLHMAHDADESVRFTVEIDATGAGDWLPYGRYDVPPHHTTRVTPGGDFAGYWVRVRSNRDLDNAKFQLDYR